jgi:hypothetical protein
MACLIYDQASTISIAVWTVQFIRNSPVSFDGLRCAANYASVSIPRKQGGEDRQQGYITGYERKHERHASHQNEPIRTLAIIFPKDLAVTMATAPHPPDGRGAVFTGSTSQ